MATKFQSRLVRRGVVTVVSCACAMAFTVPAAAGALVPAAHSVAVTPESSGVARDVDVSLFEWNWPSVARECTNVLGPAGYGSVQVSPPQDSLSRSGHPWWEVYQPVDYQLESRMGTAAQFKSMIQACHQAGVKVFVDAVVNHMTGQGDTSYGGDHYSHFDYPGLYGKQDFHHYPADCGNADDTIHGGDWENSSRNVWNCELVGLADLDTGSGYVQATIAGYLNHLTALGVDGFRIDAAKQISPSDLAGIESRMDGSPEIYQEVAYGQGEAVTPSMYYGDGNVFDFQFGRYMKDMFGGGHIADLKGFGDGWSGEVRSGKAMPFVNNHDTERDGSNLTYKDGATYVLANVFMLGWNYGTPQVYSGFTFSGDDQSPPSNAAGYVTDTSCGNGWTCFDRKPAIVGMVGFHNAVGDAAVSNWWSDGSNRIAFGRGGKGFVAINNESGGFARTFSTDLPAGTYCDVIHGTVSNGTCSGPTVTVDGSGRASVTVAGMDAVAIDVNSRVSGDSNPPPDGTVAVDFTVQATTYWGQNVFVTGSVPALGNWDPAQAVPMSAAAYPVWESTVDLPADSTVEYKYIKKNPDGSVTWETGANNSIRTGTTPMVRHDTWR